MRLVRERIGDRKVLALLEAFLGAGVVKEAGWLAATITGTPQGGIISPLLANVYLSALDRHFERAWQQQTRYIGCTTYYRRRGQATYRRAQLSWRATRRPVDCLTRASLWRAGCAETCTSGSEGGGAETGRWRHHHGAAPQPYTSPATIARRTCSTASSVAGMSSGQLPSREIWPTNSGVPHFQGRRALRRSSTASLSTATWSRSTLTPGAIPRRATRASPPRETDPA
jgi:hypothetical protein